MFKINKNVPFLFDKAIKKVKSPKNSNAWSDNNIANIRSNLRNYILENEQNGLCAYCEKKIISDAKKSNIDHFKTRNLFPQKTLDYNNLLVSCNNKNSCSTHKDRNIKNKNEYQNIINPIVEEPNDFFDYLPTGEIAAKNKNNRATFTIKIFNLGIDEAHKLVQSRKQIAKTIQYTLNLSLEEI